MADPFLDRCVLEGLQVPYELIDVNIFKGKNKAPSFKARQPFDQIQYIDDDGFELFESPAICRYLALILDPNDLKKTTLFEQAASIEMSNFGHGASSLAHERELQKAGCFTIWDETSVLIVRNLGSRRLRTKPILCTLSTTAIPRESPRGLRSPALRAEVHSWRCESASAPDSSNLAAY